MKKKQKPKFDLPSVGTRFSFFNFLLSPFNLQVRPKVVDGGGIWLRFLCYSTFLNCPPEFWDEVKKIDPDIYSKIISLDETFLASAKSLGIQVIGSEK